MRVNTGRTPDVLVVGAGPAGLSSAIACAQQGCKVVVLERQETLPIDKACGEGLMPDAVAALRQLGVEPRGCAISGIRYADECSVAQGVFDSTSVGHGLGVRRTELSRALRERAESVGVELRAGDDFLRLCPARSAASTHSGSAAGAYGLQSRSGEWQPKVIVGADGARSAVRSACGLSSVPSRRGQRDASQRVGLRAHFQEPADDALHSNSGGARPVEVFWTEGAEAYLTPVDRDIFGLAFLFSPHQRPSRQVRAGEEHELADSDGLSRGPRFDQLLACFPGLQARVANAVSVSPVRGAGSLRQRSKALARGNVALVGDAGGYVDAITGEGMAIAFAEARLLASALAKNGSVSPCAADTASALKRYRRRAARRRRLPDLLTEGALRLSRRPWLRRRFLATLAHKPALFDNVLALHARSSADRAAIPLAIDLGWRMALGVGTRSASASESARH